MGRTLCCLLIVGSCLGISACNTTKATIDSTVKFFSSTSPNSLFTADGMVEPKQKINLFAGVTYENLRQEAAAGRGQYVTALAVLYEVPVAQREDFARVLQQRHTELFAVDHKEDTQAHLKMVNALNRVLAGEGLANR